MVTPSVSPGAAPDWKKMKVQELRDELSSRGLETAGVKSVLIERLETAAPKDERDGVIAEDGGSKDMDLDVNEGAPLNQTDEKQVSEGPVGTEQSAVEVEKVIAEPAPVADEQPNVDPIAEGSVAPVESSVPVANGNTVVPSSDLQKKQRRAERFGLELMVSEGEKRRLRAARFGDTVDSKTNGTAKNISQEDASKMSPTLKDAEAVKRKARAARFGIEEVRDKSAPSSTEADDSKKKARLARFGLDIKLDPQEQEKKKLRAARFGLAVESKPDVEPEKKVVVEEPVAL